MISPNEMYVTIVHSGQKGYQIKLSHMTPRHKLPKIKGSRGWIEAEGSAGKSVTHIGGVAGRTLRHKMQMQAGITLARPGDSCSVILHLDDQNAILRVEP